MGFIRMFIWIFCIISFAPVSFAAVPVHFDFEESTEGWEIPDWAFEQDDCVGESFEVSSDMASSGESSLKIMCDFPGNIWRAIIVELQQDMDFSGFKTISVDIFLPKEAAGDLIQARIILTAGLWWFIESRDIAPLTPGQWNTVTVRLDFPPEEERAHWKFKKPEESLSSNINKIRKMVIRIEYNANEWQGGPEYKGPIYIDNIVVQ